MSKKMKMFAEQIDPYSIPNKRSAGLVMKTYQHLGLQDGELSQLHRVVKHPRLFPAAP